jgi:hypothetical protein
LDEDATDGVLQCPSAGRAGVKGRENLYRRAGEKVYRVVGV